MFCGHPLSISPKYIPQDTGNVADTLYCFVVAVVVAVVVVVV